MGKTTGIEWTHHTWSPWWGCAKVSAGCANCYADALSNRWGFKIWGQDAERRFFGDKHWNEPIRWNREAEAAGERRRVFPSMCDPLEYRHDLIPAFSRFLSLIQMTPHLDWLLVTKRPENFRKCLEAVVATTYDDEARDFAIAWLKGYAPKNVWVLASAEDQATLEKRWPALAAIPAVIHGLSLEPLLDQIDLTRIRSGMYEYNAITGMARGIITRDMRFCCKVDWVIVGGESGAKARVMHPGIVRLIRNQCIDGGVAFFFKQWGEFIPYEHDAQPPFLSSQHGQFIDGHDLPTHLTDCVNELIDGWMLTDDNQVYRRVGKADAGSKLDGESYKQFPKAVAA